MYVDTLITLQENLATYAVEGKKVTGHVTMNSPGIIKCYIQNLKGQGTGNEYVFYAFSKSKDKGVRIGKLGKNKETKWMVDEKNVQSTGLKLEELDAVAIVAEKDMRGVDTVAMGFKNNRYIIIPLIDDIVKTMQVKQGYNAKEYTPVSSTDTNKNKNLIQPEPIMKGTNPISKDNSKTNIQYTAQDTNQYANTMGQSKPNNNTLNTNVGNMANTGSNMNVGNAANTGSNMNSGNATYTGNNMNVGNASNTEKYMNAGNVSNAEKYMNAGSTSNTGSTSNAEEYMNSGNNNTENSNNMEYGNINNSMTDPKNTGQTLEEGNVQKVPLLSGQSHKNIAGEGLEDNEATLIKIAEKLQEVEKEPAIKNAGKSGIPLASNQSPAATVVRDDFSIENSMPQEDERIESITKKTEQELERIIARLKEDETISNKIQDIEQELVRLQSRHNPSQAENKSNIEEKIESRYISKQAKEQDNKSQRNAFIEEVEAEEDLEDSFDTSPKNALAFIQNWMDEFKGKEFHSFESTKKPLMDQQQSNQEEIDYISEIDRKIKEIEERRKQETDK